MKLTLFIFSILLWIGCENSNTKIATQTIETRARIVSNLAVDGCEWHFEIMNQDSSGIPTFTTYVPTRASEPRVKAAVPKYGTEDAYYFVDVEIKYRPTNEKRSIVCGFGKTSEVEVIEIVEIKTVG